MIVIGSYYNGTMVFQLSIIGIYIYIIRLFTSVCTEGIFGINETTNVSVHFTDCMK